MGRPPTDNLRILAELAAVRAKLDELCEAQEHLTRRLLEREDRRTGGALVPLLGETFQDEAQFTAAEVAAKALNDRTATGQALREVIAEHITEDAGLRSFGRLVDGVDDRQILPSRDRKHFRNL